MTTILEYYKYSTLATASYVRAGSLALGSVNYARDFVALANSQSDGRLPTSLGRRLFDPQFAVAGEAQWSVLHYYGGDIPGVDEQSGFAATLFQQGNEKVLALRGTEPDQDKLLGLDGTGIDVLSADVGQIGILGLALTQVVAMANYVMRLRAPLAELVPQIKVEASLTQPASGAYLSAQGTFGTTVYLALTPVTPAYGLNKIQPGETVKLTGHSLGGHLAVMAARLFPDIFDQEVVVFNAAGYDPTAANLLGLLDQVSILGSVQLFKSAIASEIGFAANALDTHANQLSTQALDALNAALRPSEAIEQGTPSVVSLVSEDVAPTEDFDVIASELTGADKYGTPIQVTTEANSHVIEPLMDSLSMHAFLYSMNQSLSIADTNAMLQAPSRSTIETEETLIGALYRVIKGQRIELRTSDASSAFLDPIKTGKGEIGARNAYFEKLLELQDVVKSEPSWTLATLVGMDLNELITRAQASTGIAYRYALRELNPFALLGPDSIYNDPKTDSNGTIPALNAAGDLDLYLSSTATPAGMTSGYIQDRARFLHWKTLSNVADALTQFDPSTAENWRYSDLAQTYTVRVSGTSPASPERVAVFGGELSDVAQGGLLGDRLYGGRGADLIQGGKGDDYLEGGTGNDVYHYVATQSLQGSLSNDGADEILDTDGKGVVRYTFTEAGLLSNTVRTNVIGGVGVKTSETTWQSPDGKFTYTQQFDGALGVAINGDADGSIRLVDFDFAKAQTDGFLGIRLVNAPGLPNPARVIEGDLEPLDVDPNTPGTQTDTDEFGNLLVTTNPAPDRADTLFGSDGQNASDPNDNIVAGGGDDVIDAKSGDDIVQGGTGRDTIDAGTGNDLVEAGANGTDPGDIVQGGDGADRLYADARFDPAGTPAAELAAALAAGESQGASGLKGDFLSAGLGNDIAIGAVGNDVLAGGAGSDILVAGVGNDFLLGDSRVRAANLDWDVTRTSTGQYPIPAPLGPIFDFALFNENTASIEEDPDAGADTLYGGAGNDWMDGGAKDDHLDAGSGNDVAFGNLGNDVLLGGAGDDVLDGDHVSIAASSGGDDYLDGGGDNDWLYGRGGDDILFGGGGNDNMEGNEGKDILVGGPGSDVLRGGTGKDTYVLNRGDGFDAVFDTSDTLNVADASVVVLGGEITRGAVKFRPGSLIIDAGEGDGLHIEGFNPDDPLSTPVLSTIQFADGDFMSFDDVLAQGFDIDGTEGDDVIQGTAVTDRINALGGNDDIYAKAGDDTIDAGTGNDIVEAGDGDDTIITGEGADIVFGGAGDDTVFADDGDLIIDTEGTNQLDLTAYTGLTDANLEITQYQAPDGEIYLNFHIRDDLNPGATPAVGGVSVQKGELGTFATVTVDDGAGGTVTLTHAELMQQYSAQGLVYDGSGAPETLIGTSFADTFFGGAGADAIQAGAGDDRIDGGTGEDVLEGGAGNDTYLLAYNGARDTVIEDGAAEPNALHTVQLDAGIASTQVKATRSGDDVEVRLKATADALVIKDFYLQPGSWQAGWQVKDANGVTTVLTDYVPVIPPAAGDWLSEEADAFRARREQVFAANRSTEGYNALGGNAFQRTEQVFDYALRSSAGSTTTRALEVQLLNTSDSSIFVSTDFLSTPLAQTSGGFDIGLPIAGASGGDRGGVSAAFGTGGAPSGQGSEFIATGSGSLGLSGSSIQLDAGDYAVPVYQPKSGNAGGIRNSGGVDYSNAGSFNNSDLWELAGFQVVYAGGGGGSEFGREAATATYFNYDQRLTVTDVVAGPESSSILVDDASVVEAGDGDDDIALGAGFFFTGPDWERALNPDFAPPHISNFDTHQGERKNNLGGFVDAGAGADTITGSFGQDAIAGGTDGDEMDGREGSDRYLLAVSDTGTDVIVDRGTDQHDYYNWFYWGRGIFDWEERLDHGNQWRADFDTETSYFDTEAEVDEAITNAGFHDKRFISPLPELAPAVSWNDSAITTQLVNAGVMAQDTVEFGPGISVGDLEFSWDQEKVAVQSQDTGSLEDVAYAILRISWGLDSAVRIAMPRPDDPLGFGIERFRFADGTTLSLANMVTLAPAPAPDFGPATVIDGTPFLDILSGTSRSDEVYGHEGNDTIFGGWGSDLLVGGQGNDFLSGFTGSDTYLYSPGDGNDTINDGGESALDIDTLQLVAGIMPWDVAVERDANHLYVQVWASGETLTLEDWFVNPSSRVERVEFDNGTVWSASELEARAVYPGEEIVGTEGDDILIGTLADDYLQGLGGNDTLQGLQGGDGLEGGEGSDLYLYAAGDGRDYIFDEDLEADDVDTLRFAPGILPADVGVTRDEYGYYLVMHAGADQVYLDSMASDPAYEIERVEFNDGTVWLPADVAARVALLPGTAYDDVLWGTGGDDTIQGLGGHDFLYGHGGNDAMAGGAGGDTYVIALGDGHDTIDNYDTDDYENPELADQISFGEDISSTDVTLQRSGNDLVIVIGAGDDSVRLAGWYLGEQQRIDEVFFNGDFVSWDRATIGNLAPATGNSAPQVSSPLADQATNEDAAFGFSVPASTFFDPDAGDVLTYAATQADGSALPGWLAFDAETRTFSGTPLQANVGAIDVKVTASDGEGLSAEDTFALTVANVNDAPAVTPAAATQTLLLGQSVDASSLFAVADEDGDAPAQYEFWDSSAGNGHFAVNGVERGVNVAIVVAAADLADADFVGGSEAGSDLVWVRATDGQAFGAWKSWTMNSWPHATNAKPVADAPDGAVLRDEAVLAQSLFTVNDADTDTITQVEFWDDTAGGGYFALDGVAQTNNPISVTAAQLAGVEYVGGADPGTERVWVRANDGLEWGAWESWNMTTALHIPNAAPEATPAAATQTVLLGQGVSASTLFSVNDADGDAIAQYEFFDSTASNGHFAVNSVEQAVNVSIVVSAADLASTAFVGSAQSGSDTVWVRATDGQSFGEWKSWTMNSWPHATNAAPVAEAANETLLTGEVVAAGTLFTVTDADGDTAVRYEFWDDVAGGGYWRVNGVQQAAAAAVALDAGEIADAEYVGGANPGSEQVWVRVNDGLEWGAWESWTMSTVLHDPNAAPVVTAANATVLLGQSAEAATLFSVTDADADTITQYEFWDSTAGNGRFTVNGAEQGVNMAIGVTAAQLAGTEFVGAASTGSDLVWVRASDGMVWSDWKSWTMNSWPHLANTAPVVAAASAGVLRSEALSASMFFGVSDADGDAPVQFEFWDDVNGGGHWALDGVQQASGQAIAVNAVDLANLDYVGGANPGTEQVWVRASDGMSWSPWKNWLMSTEGGMLRGGAGPDTLIGEAGPTVLEGGAGDDTLTDTDGDNLLSGGEGDDTMTAGDGDDLLAGGTGNDTIDTGGGSNVIAYNTGGGIDTVFAGAGAANTLSFGGGIGYDDLNLSKDGNDLIVSAGENDRVVLKDWYAGSESVLNLQIILDATEEFDANSSDPLYNRKVQTFDFAGLVAEFDEALAQSPGLTSWAVTNALLQFHLSGADDAAIGGDLAYWYGRNNGFTGISLAAAQAAIGAPGFGADAQTLHPFSGLQEGLVKLS